MNPVQYAISSISGKQVGTFSGGGGDYDNGLMREAHRLARGHCFIEDAGNSVMYFAVVLGSRSNGDFRAFINELLTHPTGDLQRRGAELNAIWAMHPTGAPVF